jgi:uncharacterized protein
VLTDDIKAQFKRALREKDELVKNVLSVALGEIQTAEARANRALRDDEVVAILRKLVKSNEETLALSGPGAGGDAGTRADALRREIAVISALLPAILTDEEIAQALAPVTQALRDAKSGGQAMGLAMKHLKATGAAAHATNVQSVVEKIRRA